jgi:hypothetical protein
MEWRIWYAKSTIIHESERFGNVWQQVCLLSIVGVAVTTAAAAACEGFEASQYLETLWWLAMLGGLWCCFLLTT